MGTEPREEEAVPWFARQLNKSLWFQKKVWPAEGDKWKLPTELQIIVAEQ